MRFGVVPANEVVNISRTSSPRNGFAVIAGGARLCARREGWPRVRALRPSFETLASQAPQDEVGDILHKLERRDAPAERWRPNHDRVFVGAGTGAGAGTDAGAVVTILSNFSSSGLKTNS